MFRIFKAKEPVSDEMCQRPAWCGAAAAECEALLARCAVERLLEALRRDSLSPYKRLCARDARDERRPGLLPTLPWPMHLPVTLYIHIYPVASKLNVRSLLSSAPHALPFPSRSFFRNSGGSSSGSSEEGGGRPGHEGRCEGDGLGPVIR